MEELTLGNGYTITGLTKDCMECLVLLTKTTEECDIFVFSFLVYSCNSNLAVNSYRLHRIKERNITLDEFVSLYSVDPLSALYELFLHPIKKKEISKLQERLDDGVTTIEGLFVKHRKEPRARMLKLLI